MDSYNISREKFRRFSFSFNGQDPSYRYSSQVDLFPHRDKEERDWSEKHVCISCRNRLGWVMFSLPLYG